MSEALPPQNLDAEKFVLGSIILAPELLSRAEAILRPENFYRTSNGRIFAAMQALSSRSLPIDDILLRDELARTGELEAIGGPAYIASLPDVVSTPAHIEYYARLVLEKSADRAARITLEALANAINSRNGEGPGEGREDIEARADAVIQAISVMRRAREPEAVKAEDLADILKRPIPKTPWAVPGLIACGDIGIISGPGGIGKTWIALLMALGLATGRSLFEVFKVERAFRVAFLDLESRPWETDQRLLRAVTGMGLADADLRGMFRVIRQRLRFDRPQDVRRLMVSLKEWQTEFLFVDSLRRTHGGDENRSETTSALFLESLDPIRLELGCGTILTDHTRKLTGEKELDSAELSLRGSGDKRNLVDFHLGIEARQERLAVLPTKTRHSRLVEPFLVQINGFSEDEPDSGPVRLQYVGSLDKASDKVQDAILALLDDAADKGLLRGEIIGRCGYSERACDDALRALKERDRVSKQPEGKHVRYIRPQRPQTTAQAERKPE